MLQVAFWGSVFLVVYPYLFYPALVLLLAGLRPRPVQARPLEASVTILIPAYNEAECIGSTIQNKLDQDYPREKLQILVVSDGSTDGTDEIVRRFADHGVQLLRRAGREGKAAALNEAIRMARGEIVVFSDANSLFDRNAIRYMVENFADPDVGYLTGALWLIDENATVSGGGIDTYMRYENLVRRAETRVGSIIGVNGGVDAIRRELYSDIPAGLITDFVLPLRVMAAGHRVIFDPRVIAREVANTELDSEFRMRVRVALRALQGLMHMRALLNPVRHPLASFGLISHKLLRYVAFVFMVIALLTNAALAWEMPGYRLLFVIHVLLYALAGLGMTRASPARLRWLTVVPSYLLMSYAAFAVAVFKFLRGQTMATWQPRTG